MLPIRRAIATPYAAILSGQDSRAPDTHRLGRLGARPHRPFVRGRPAQPVGPSWDVRMQTPPHPDPCTFFCVNSGSMLEAENCEWPTTYFISCRLRYSGAIIFPAEPRRSDLAQTGPLSPAQEWHRCDVSPGLGLFKFAEGGAEQRKRPKKKCAEHFFMHCSLLNSPDKVRSREWRTFGRRQMRR